MSRAADEGGPQRPPSAAEPCATPSAWGHAGPFSLLAPDEVRAVLCASTVAATAALGCSCRALRLAAEDDGVWASHAAAWAAQHAAAPAEELLAALRAGDYRSLLRALRALGGQPTGLWRSLDDGPRGAALLVSVDAGGPVGSLLLPTEDDHGAHTRLFTISAAGDFVAQAGFRRETPWLAARALRVVAGGHRLELVCPHPHEVGRDGSGGNAAAPGTVALFGLLLGQRDVGRHTWAADATVVASFQRVPRPPPSASPMLVGVFSCSYGGTHGVELVHVVRADGRAGAGAGACCGEPLPPAAVLPPCEWRLEGQKVTGDPNVPAGRLTFVAALGATPGAALSLPLHRAAGEYLEPASLSGRRVRAVHPAAMQINAVPGDWRPAWNPATLVEYDDAARPDGVAFSLVWHMTGGGGPLGLLKDFAAAPAWRTLERA